MKKKLLLFMLFVLTSIGGISYSTFIEPVSIILPGIAEVFKTKLAPIHFKAGGDNLGGMLLITEQRELNGVLGEVVIPSGDKRQNCKYQLRGYYYNPLHSNTLYPLDQETLNKWKGGSVYKDLTLSGGIYIGCSGNGVNQESIYGQVIFNKKGEYLSSLTMGFKYDVSKNSIDWNFADNFQFKDGYLVGLVYDDLAGIGFVGGNVNTKFEELVEALNDDTVSDVVTEIANKKIKNTVGADVDTDYGVKIESKIFVNGLSSLGGLNNGSLATKQFKLQARKYSKLLIDNKLLNISVVLNKLRKTSYKLCRGKWVNNISYINPGDTICFKGDDNEIIVDSDLTSSGKVTNIVINGENNKLIFKKSQSGLGYLNVFVDKGYVLFDNNINLEKIDINGQVVQNNDATKGTVFRGNIFVNGLIAGYDGSNISHFKHKMYIYGSVGSLNTIGKNQARERYIQNNTYFNKEFVDVTRVFDWFCNDTGIGVDGVDCSNTNDKYLFNSLIIQKVDYKKSLLK